MTEVIVGLLIGGSWLVVGRVCYRLGHSDARMGVQWPSRKRGQS